MRGLVVGGGAIGKRHLQNLRTLGVEELSLVEPDSVRANHLCEELAISVFPALADALVKRPDFAVIASPPHLHVRQAMEVARFGSSLFIEKPLSHEEYGLQELSASCDQQELISMVACNMRFHPGPAKIKQLILDNAVGKILFARLHVGSYLPDWRSGSDYRSNYAAHKNTGGGCILDCIHEIDLVRWYLGEVVEVACMSGHLSSLQIDAEDVAALICRHESGVLSEVHMDYVQRTYERGCEIVGENGTIRWDFTSGSVRVLRPNAGSQDFSQPDSWLPNQMYVDEMEHFLQCIRQKQPTVLPIGEAVRVTRIALAARESSETGRRVQLEVGVLA